MQQMFKKQTLLHPTYVYCIKFHPTQTNVAVTGCFDHIIRIWSISQSSPSRKSFGLNDCTPLAMVITISNDFFLLLKFIKYFSWPSWFSWIDIQVLLIVWNFIQMGNISLVVMAKVFFINGKIWVTVEEIGKLKSKK